MFPASGSHRHVTTLNCPLETWTHVFIFALRAAFLSVFFWFGDVICWHLTCFLAFRRVEVSQSPSLSGEIWLKWWGETQVMSECMFSVSLSLQRLTAR